jgi:hypothetical protein
LRIAEWANILAGLTCPPFSTKERQVETRQAIARVVCLS